MSTALTRRPTLGGALGLLLALTTALPLFAGFAGTDVFLPSVGRRPGNFGSQYYTMLWIHNPSASTANVTIAFLLRNQPNPTPATYLDSIPPGDSRSYPDTLTTLFNTQAWGALRITSNVRVIALCRMYNLPAGGQDKDTQGQGYNAVPASFAIGSGQSTKLLGVSQTNPKADSEFRYSFGWVEAAGGTANVQVTAFDETGTQLASKTYPTTGAYEARYYAIEDLYPAVNATNLTLQVSVVSGSGKVIPVGSGTANTSNDSTTFEMQFADALLGGTGGLSAVTHDASLTGDGTSGAPLAIADAGVGKSKLKASGGINGQVLGTDGINLRWQDSGGGALALPYSGTVSSSAPAVQVTNTGSGGGLLGASSASFGVTGTSTDFSGVLGQSANGEGVHGESTTSTGVHGKSASGVGVVGESASQMGVYGVSGTADGVQGSSTSGNGVHGKSNSGYAGMFEGNVRVDGSFTCQGCVGVGDLASGAVAKTKLAASGGTSGQVLGTDGSSLVWQNAGSGGLTLPYSGSANSSGVAFEVLNNGSGRGINGYSAGGAGIHGASGIGVGVVGEGPGIGVSGISTNGDGIIGQSTTVRGVHGISTSGYGVLGESQSNFGVVGSSGSKDGVYGTSDSGYGVHGLRTIYEGFLGYSDGGVLGRDDNSGHYGYLGMESRAALFSGPVEVDGDFSVTGGHAKNFMIDHPLDPENRLLVHAAVESSEVLDVYSGNVVTDAEGRAGVRLPDWFEAVNTDFRYQLTVIGRFAQAIVEKKIVHNAFTIRTNIADVEVSWQVTARRNDPGTRLHPFEAERDKPAAERGTYLRPEAYGQPEEKGVEWVRHPDLMRQMWEQRARKDDIR